MDASSANFHDPWLTADGFRVAATLTDGDVRPRRPTLTVVAGQMGSGKTVAIRGIARSLPPGEGFTIMDGDALHQLDPRYADLESSKGTRVAKHQTAPFAGQWAERLKAVSIRSGRHVIAEIASSDADLAAIATSYSVEGYRTRLVVLAVPEHQSRQAIALREEAEREAKGHGRHVSQDEHDHSYARWPTALAHQVRRAAFDEICVAEPDRSEAGGLREIARLTRVRDPGATRARWDGSHSSLLEAMIATRAKPVEKSDALKHCSDWEDHALTQRPALRDAIRRQAQEDLRILTQPPIERHRREANIIANAQLPAESALREELIGALRATKPQVARPMPRRLADAIGR